MITSKPNDIDEYIAGFPPPTQEILQQIRTVIKKVAPGAEETISYGIPTFNLNGTYLIYFAAYKKHIGIYPVPSETEKIDKEFASFKTSGKGTIQFPLNKPLPLKLIAKLVSYKVKENIEGTKKKQIKKTTRRQPKGSSRRAR
jgi:uncharacterized protein YdhG (YjbR/CyaY superfamily)